VESSIDNRQSATEAATRRITAFLDGPDSLDIGNIIHSTAGASAYGFRGPLVGGVTVYGWTVPAILDVLGERWLEDGWADVSFRRPVHPGDQMTARVERTATGASLVMENQDGEACISGELGLGTAAWLKDIAVPSRPIAEPRPAELPQLTPEVAPVGRELRPMAVPMALDDARAYALEKQADDSARWTGPGARIHPGWIAARMTPLLHHSYDYGPAIHTRTQVQHLAPALAGQTVTMAGIFRETYERKGHQYGVIDGVMLAEDRRELARLRHTTIYVVGRREEGER